MLIDTHCHLSSDRFDQDRAEILQRARDAGVTRTLNIGTDPDDWARYLDLLPSLPGCRLALGFHPNYADRFTKEGLAKLEALCEEFGSLIAGIGETGLDFFRDYCPEAAQVEAFEAQLTLAHRLNLPFILHCRAAEGPMLERLRAFRDRTGEPPRGVWHCFTPEPEWLEPVLDLGLYVGVGGVLTYKKAQTVRDNVRAFPREKLLLETDAPYLPPEPHRGKRNEPAYTALTAHALADLLDLDFATVARLTTENAERLFGTWPG
jgi:TatD DNase family protein